MLKLKIATASLALVGMMLLILGDTYMSATLAVVCTAVALPLAGHLAWRWLLHDHSLVPFVLWIPVAELPALYAFKDLGGMDTPLGATPIEPEKMDTLGGFVALISAIAILLAVVIPSSPMRDDDED